MNLGKWVVDIISQLGEVGVGALMALENVIPPIPSEVILPFAGFSIAQGALNAPLVWLAATVGALVGAYALYALGALVSYQRLVHLAGKRWFFLISQTDLIRGERVFENHGGKIVLLGRCIPLVRSAVSVPAGITRMPLWKFTALTVTGTGVWNALFLYLGYQLGNRYEEVQHWLKPASYLVLAALLLGIIWLIERRWRTYRARR